MVILVGLGDLVRILVYFGIWKSVSEGWWGGCSGVRRRGFIEPGKMWGTISN